MAALFAYLICLVLLLGGGYGALEWLAAPEPVKVASKAKRHPHPRYEASEASAELASSETKPPDANGNDRPESVADVKPPMSQPPVNAEMINQGTPAKQEAPALASSASPQPVPDTANAQPVEPKPVQTTSASGVSERSSEAAAPVSSSKQHTASNTGPAAAGPTAVATNVKRSPRRSRLVLMTLRTIEFPDGHRATQLIPYRGGDRGLPD